MVNNKEFQKLALQNRIQILQGRGDKNVKAPGVLRKLKRQLRNLEKEDN